MGNGNKRNYFTALNEQNNFIYYSKTDYLSFYCTVMFDHELAYIFDNLYSMADFANEGLDALTFLSPIIK